MSSSINLRPLEFRLVRTILAAHVPDREVRAFGSRVRGPAKPSSDLDLCIMGHQPLSPLELHALSDAFSASVLPFKVDLIEWATATNRFRAIIEPASILLQAAPRVPQHRT